MNRRPTKPGISDAERALFRENMERVAPLGDSARRRPERRLPSTRPRSTEADEREVLAALLDDAPEDLETGEELVYARPGVQHGVMRRLRRGGYRCQGELDLHGLFVPAAREALARFLAESRDSGRRCVRIVHGKGLRSPNGQPVLKSKVARWLARRRDVLAYCSAPAHDGGLGALYALLKKR